LEPRLKYETDGLVEGWEDEVNSTSRLACLITLEKKHDGMLVYVPDAPPVEML
jgi:hypothetical protein